MREIIISKDEAGQRLNKYLMKYLDKAPSSFVYKMIRKKNIKLNGNKATGSEIIYLGDVIQVYMSDDTISSFRSQGIEKTKEKPKGYFKPEVIYADRDILIAHKPQGVLTQKASKDDYSLNEAVIDYLLDSGHISKDTLMTFKPSVCNRLDRNTSGIVLCGISLTGSQELSRIIREHLLDKYYYTIVKGSIKSSMDVTAYLVKDEKTNMVQVFSSKEKAFDKAGNDKPEEIHSIFTPIQCKGGYTELKVRLITGKTHQIRAQLKSLGYPIIGDSKYGDSKENIQIRQRFKLKNQLLHCGEITFADIDGALSYLSGKSFSAFKPPIYKTIERELFD